MIEPLCITVMVLWYPGVSILGVTTHPDFGVGVVVFPRNISYNVKKYGTRTLSKVVSW